MKRYVDWSGCDFDQFVHPGDEIDAEMYHYFEGCVPPIYFPYGFLCGEAARMRKGELIYSAFTLFDEKYRYIGEYTVTEATVIGRFLKTNF